MNTSLRSFNRTFVSSLLAIIIIVAPNAFAEPLIKRTNSSISVSWESNENGKWELINDKGVICKSGLTRRGHNEILLGKVSPSTDFQFVLSSTNLISTSKSYNLLGNKEITPLSRPEYGAIIYQLPVRTYLAKGIGRTNRGKLEYLSSEHLQDIKELGTDYLWLTGVLEQSSLEQTDADVVKGDAGSYYAIHDIWDISPQIGNLDKFSNAVQRAHGQGLRVMIDFVANHTARAPKTDVIGKEHLDFGRTDYKNDFFNRDNNFYYIQNSSMTPPARTGEGMDGIFDTDIFSNGIQLEIPARVTGNDIMSPSPASYDWFDTAKLNYGYDLETKRAYYSPRPRTWNQMVEVAKYWISMGVDGFRVDFAHSVPIEFWRFFCSELRSIHPEVFLVAEAYETDENMKLPGFSYYALLDAGFDSVYNSNLYWGMRNEARQPGTIRNANPQRTAAMRQEILQRGFLFTNYLENHDEVRVASRHFAPFVGDRDRRAKLGLAYSAYSALLPGHFLVHGGQEFQEDANVVGRYAGDTGRTSIFDFVHQEQTRQWIWQNKPYWQRQFRDRYQKLFALKKSSPFNSNHTVDSSSYIDLDGANWYKEQSKWIASYVRYSGDDSYLVVLNSDPSNAHTATIHFTNQENSDPLGTLNAIGIENDETRYIFEEKYSREGWIPRDPAITGTGIPGSVLYQSGGVPSGLYLGDIPAATTLVLKITRY